MSEMTLRWRCSFRLRPPALGTWAGGMHGARPSPPPSLSAARGGAGACLAGTRGSVCITWWGTQVPSQGLGHCKTGRPHSHPSGVRGGFGGVAARKGSRGTTCTPSPAARADAPPTPLPAQSCQPFLSTYDGPILTGLARGGLPASLAWPSWWCTGLQGREALRMWASLSGSGGREGTRAGPGGATSAPGPRQEEAQ